MGGREPHDDGSVRANRLGERNAGRAASVLRDARIATRDKTPGTARIA